MEQVHNNNEQVEGMENVREKTFAEVMRSIVFRFNQERETISTFGTPGAQGKQFAITSTAGAVKALGQLPSSMAETVYNEIVKK